MTEDITDDTNGNLLLLGYACPTVTGGKATALRKEFWYRTGFMCISQCWLENGYDSSFANIRSCRSSGVTGVQTIVSTILNMTFKAVV